MSKEIKTQHLFHPWFDFICLGGASLLILPMLYFVSSEQQLTSWLMVTLLLANVINHPHFALSLLIFYRTFFHNLIDPLFDKILKIRMVFAGIVVPGVMLVFFYRCVVTADLVTIGYAANAMLFLVGWHYAKQGYGMLMLDSVLKKQFFTKKEKDLLRYNAHVCWFCFWLFANDMVSERSIWGLNYYSFSVPISILYAAILVALVSSSLVALLLFRLHLSAERSLPIVGVMAYTVSIYVWLLGRFHPAMLMVIPVFHSLQYITVVARYEINRSSVLTHSKRDQKVHLVLFSLLAIGLGGCGFWLFPILNQQWVNPEYTTTFGSGIFLFIYWIFINIHHYFIDNVIWRRENKETSKYLFTH